MKNRHSSYWFSEIFKLCTVVFLYHLCCCVDFDYQQCKIYGASHSTYFPRGSIHPLVSNLQRSKTRLHITHCVLRFVTAWQSRTIKLRLNSTVFDFCVPRHSHFVIGKSPVLLLLGLSRVLLRVFLLHRFRLHTSLFNFLTL